MGWFDTTGASLGTLAFLMSLFCLIWIVLHCHYHNNTYEFSKPKTWFAGGGDYDYY